MYHNCYTYQYLRLYVPQLLYLSIFKELMIVQKVCLYKRLNMFLVSNFSEKLKFVYLSNFDTI